MAPTPLPTVAPAPAILVPAAVPPPPQGLTPTQSTEWRTNHEFVHLLEAIYEHIKRLPNRQSEHIRELTLLYWNAYIAGVVLNGQNYHRWANKGSLFSHKSRLKLANANLILAAKNLPEAKTVKTALDTWNMYLQSLNLPRVDRVGDGLNRVANPGPTMGPGVGTAIGAAGGVGAPARLTLTSGVTVGGPAGVGTSNPPVSRTTAAASGTMIGNRSSAITKDNGDSRERLSRLTRFEQAAAVALLELKGSAAGPSTAAPGAAPVGPGDDDDAGNEEEKADDSNDEQPPTKRQRVEDSEDRREEADPEEQGRSKGKGKERATDW